jgi:hypothetical protein
MRFAYAMYRRALTMSRVIAGGTGAPTRPDWHWAPT